MDTRDEHQATIHSDFFKTSAERFLQDFRGMIRDVVKEYVDHRCSEVENSTEKIHRHDVIAGDDAGTNTPDDPIIEQDNKLQELGHQSCWETRELNVRKNGAHEHLSHGYSCRIPIMKQETPETNTNQEHDTKTAHARKTQRTICEQDFEEADENNKRNLMGNWSVSAVEAAGYLAAEDELLVEKVLIMEDGLDTGIRGARAVRRRVHGSGQRARSNDEALRTTIGMVTLQELWGLRGGEGAGERKRPERKPPDNKVDSRRWCGKHRPRSEEVEWRRDDSRHKRGKKMRQFRRVAQTSESAPESEDESTGIG